MLDTPLRVLALLLAAAVPAGAAAVRQPHEDATTIHACARNGAGWLRLVSTAGDCRRREQPVTWNVRGPAGPAGAPGPAGPAGPPGPQGPQGDAGTSITSLGALAGLACHAGGKDGKVALTYDASAHAVLTCTTSSTPAPPPPPPPPPPPSETPSVRVNELATGTSAAASDEFVEMVNASSASASLGGYKLVYRSGTGTSDVVLATIPEGTTLAAGGFYLLGGSGYAGAATPNQSFSAGLAATAGGVGLRDPSGQLVDSVGYGTATNAFVEAHAASAPPTTAPPGSSVVRFPDGHDTNDNSLDLFVSSSPTPKAANKK